MVEISGSRQLHRIIYFSRFSRDFPKSLLEQDADVDQIVKTSIKNNSSAEITGLLLVHQNSFIQALEGPAVAVMTRYGQIVRDSRHTDATIIVAAPATSRLFGEWNMCARRLNATSNAILRTLDLKGDFDPGKLSGESAQGLLCAVGKILGVAA